MILENLAGGMLLALTGIGIILLIVWYATEGEKKKNRFGNPIKIK